MGEMKSVGWEFVAKPVRETQTALRVLFARAVFVLSPFLVKLEILAQTGRCVNKGFVATISQAKRSALVLAVARPLVGVLPALRVPQAERATLTHNASRFAAVGEIFA